MTERKFRVAPPGFTAEQWEEFLERGMLIFRNALSKEEEDRHVEAIDQARASDPNYRPGQDYRVTNAVAADPVLSELIDHPRHVGYGYDLYGELLKVQRSDFFVRPRNPDRSRWHPDSPRPTPYATFSPVLPLRLCIGYWLTDLPHTGMDNFIYLPGSYNYPVFEHYYTHQSVPGEEALCVPAGTDSDPDADPRIPLRIRRRRTMPERIGIPGVAAPGPSLSGAGA